MAKDKETSVRKAVTKAIGETGNPCFLPLLNTLAKDQEKEVRKEVIFSTT